MKKMVLKKHEIDIFRLFDQPIDEAINYLKELKEKFKDKPNPTLQIVDSEFDFDDEYLAITYIEEETDEEYNARLAKEKRKSIPNP